MVTSSLTIALDSTNNIHWKLLAASIYTCLTKSPTDGLVDYDTEDTNEDTWDSYFQDRSLFPESWLQ